MSREYQCLTCGRSAEEPLHDVQVCESCGKAFCAGCRPEHQAGCSRNVSPEVAERIEKIREKYLEETRRAGIGGTDGYEIYAWATETSVPLGRILHAIEVAQDDAICFGKPITEFRQVSVFIRKACDGRPS